MTAGISAYGAAGATILLATSLLACSGGGDQRTTDSGRAAALEALGQLDSVFAVGDIDGDPFTALGRVVAMEITDQGVFVLDRDNHRLLWYDTAGHPVAAAGRNGGGPGEFASPAGLAATGSGSLLVLDQRLARITEFLPAGEVLTHARDVRVTVSAADLCEADGAIVINALGSNGILHVLNTDGQIERSFGAPLEELHEEVRNVQWFRRTGPQNEGVLVCGHAVAPIIFAHREIPYVRAFDLEGTELWRVKLSDFRVQRFVFNEDRGTVTTAHDPETGTVSYVMAAAVGPDGTVWVTTHEYSLGDRIGAYHLYRLAPENGEELDRSPAAYAIAGVRRAVSYGFRVEPFSRIYAYRSRASSAALAPHSRSEG